MALKTINFYAHKLSAFNIDLDSIDFSDVLLQKLPNYTDVLQSGDPISLMEVNEKGKFILGTLAHTQMNDLSPVVDSLTKKIMGEIPISPTQGLGHFTSFLFDKDLQFLIFESKQMGVTLGSFCHFFSRNYQLAPIENEFVLDPAELEKLSKLRVIKKFSVKIAKVVDGSIFETKRSSFNQIIRSADDTNTNVLEYSISSDRGETLTLSKVKQMVRDLFKYTDDNEVSKLEIKGKETEEDADQIINFVTNRVKISIQVERKRFSQSFALTEKYALLEEEYLKIRPHLLRAYKMKKVTK